MCLDSTLLSFLRVCLRFVYFFEIENILLKVLLIKVKISCNSIVKFMNNIKKYSKVYE